MTIRNTPAAGRVLPSPDVPPPGAKFRPDIQGLRTLAVLAVVLDHANIPGFAGGFTGVDVFFVISGFLITGLLIGDVAKHGRVRLLAFYARRAARILPAATVVIIATALGSAALLGVLAARSVFADALWAVFFAANVHFAAVGTNYFAQSTTSPLLHYWSLAVEEQFYLVWPFLIAVVTVICRKVHAPAHALRLSVGSLLLVAGTGSIYLSVTQTAANPTAAYFSTLDRAWELACGAAIALLLPALPKIPAGLRAALSWLGVGAIIAAVLVFNANTPVPGDAALLPVLGAAAVIVGGVGPPGRGAHRLLSLRPLRVIGDLSYSLYLWHFPILILAAAYFGASDTLLVRLALVITAVGVSAVSYYCVENPVRHATVILRRTWRGLIMWPLATGLVGLVVFVATPTVSFAAATNTNMNIAATTAVANAVVAAKLNVPIPHATSPGLATAESDSVNLGDCSAYLALTSKICNYGDPTGTRTVVVFGNSHSSMWVPAVAHSAKLDHWKFFPVVKEACSYDAYTNIKHFFSPKNDCSTWYRWALVQIKRLHPNVVVIGSLTTSRFWRAGEIATIEEIKPLTSRTVLLSDTPTIPSPASCLLTNGATQGTCLVHETPQVINDQVATAHVAATTGVQYVNVTAWFCNRELCPSLINDIVPYYDALGHVTLEYSKFLGPDMATALNLTGTLIRSPVAIPLPTGPTTTPAPTPTN